MIFKASGSQPGCRGTLSWNPRVLWNTWVPLKALVVVPISKGTWYLQVNNSQGCRQIVKKLLKGATNQKG